MGDGHNFLRLSPIDYRLFSLLAENAYPVNGFYCAARKTAIALLPYWGNCAIASVSQSNGTHRP